MIINEFRQLVWDLARSSGYTETDAQNVFDATIPAIGDDAVAALDADTAHAIIACWLADFFALPRAADVSPSAANPSPSLLMPSTPRRAPAAGATVPRFSSDIFDALQETLATAPARVSADADSPSVVAIEVNEADHRRSPGRVEARIRNWADEPNVEESERAQRMDIAEYMLTHLEPSDDGFIHLESSLNLNCHALTSLPENLRIAGHLCLNRCSALTSLPDNLCVSGDIDSSRCTALRTLPSSLRVGRNLSLVDCTALTSLPNGLCIDGDLVLRGCTSLEAIPEDLLVGGDLDLSWCPNITTLPSGILRWPVREDGRRHVINLESSGIPQTIIRMVVEVPPNGVRFRLGLPGAAHPMVAASTDFGSLDEAVKFWLALDEARSSNSMAGPSSGCAHGESCADADSSQSSSTLPPTQLSRGGAIAALGGEEAAALQSFLSRLRETADYANASTRPILTGRVMALLRAIDEHSDLRERLLAQMVVALTSCGDRVILSLNDMEIEQRTMALEGKGREAHIAFARSLLALEEVRRQADQKVRDLPGVDEIEIRLAYEIRVADALALKAATSSNCIELPVSTRSMLFPHCASQVTSADIDQATGAALAAACDDDTLNAHLAVWPPWLRLMRSERVARLTRNDIAIEDVGAMTDGQREALVGCCPISLCPPEPEDLVFIYCGRTLQVFGLEGLLQHWVEHGTNPVNRQSLDLGQLRRLP